MNQKRPDAKAMSTMTLKETAKVSKVRTLKQRRRELWMLLGLSGGLDIALFFAELPLGAGLLGIPLLVDEVVEFGISLLIGRNRLTTKWYDKVIGLLPIPGVTAITVRAGLELIRSFVRPGKFMEIEPALNSK